MSDDRKAAIVIWTITIFKVAFVFAIALLILGLAGAMDNGQL